MVYADVTLKKMKKKKKKTRISVKVVLVSQILPHCKFANMKRLWCTIVMIIITTPIIHCNAMIDFAESSV